MTIPDETDPVLEEATDWLLRLQASPGDPAVTAAFDAWLAGDEARVIGWQRVQKAWHAIGEASPQSVSQPLARRWAARRIVAGAAALAAALLLLLLWQPLEAYIRADYRTTAGQTREAALADGAVVHLATDTALRVDYSATRRSVVLLSGQAYFDVPPDPERPFTVEAGGLEIAVVGTAFDVQMKSGTFVVAVEHGVVVTRYRANGVVVDRRLQAGERIAIDRATGLAAVTKASPSNVAAWRTGRLFVENATIAEVVEELDRWWRGGIWIADRDLAARRVTGFVDLNDTDNALRAIVEPYSARVREVTPYIRVLVAQ